MGAKFKKGMEVSKTFYGLGGYKETTREIIAMVSKGVVYLESGSGITYDASTGRELENFFPGMRTEIVSA